jgi:RNA polymerase sigma-70 factor (ECF subfamily)
MPPPRLAYSRRAVPEPSDEQLLRLVGDGDGRAFELLWTRYSRPVLSLATRLLGDRAAGEDATQETFATVWRAAETFDSDRGAATAWLFTVARNTTRDIARRRRIPPVPEGPDQEDPSPGPEQRAATELDAFLVHRALEDLAPRAREVIELAYFGGLSQSEIAERTGTPIGTVKTRTRNALGRLAEALATIGEAR